MLLHKEEKLYTATGDFECTPELFLSKNKKLAPKSVDIFSLGATLYEMFTQKTICDTTNKHNNTSKAVQIFFKVKYKTTI